MLTEERGVTKGKGGYADQWHHDVTDEHGNPKHPPGTKKHHEGRAEEHKHLSRDADYVDHYNHVTKEKKHIIAVADAHKKAAEAHEKVLTLKGKQLHPDHPHVHAAMKATENVHKAQKAQKDYHNSSEYKAMEKKRQAKRDQEHEKMKYTASISDHKRNLAHAKDPSIRRHDEAKRQLADFHATRKALKDPKHPDHKEAQHKAKVFPYKYGDHLAKIKESVSNMRKEDLDGDPQSMDNRRLSAIARNPNHPLHTHAKAEMDRRRLDGRAKRVATEGAMKRIATTQASKTDRMASTDKKGLETFKKKPTSETKDAFGRLGITSPTMKHIDKKLDKVTQRTQTVMNKRPRSTMEAKDPNEYDNEGSMMKSQLRQISSANEKLMSMVKDDDNLPEWVQAKVTKATDYIRSVRDYLESEKMEEKTLTPAEIRKRDKIAKAIKKDDPDMPMDKKMAIATATAKRVAESKDDDYHKTLSQTKNSYEGIAALKKKHGMSHTKAVATMRRLMKDSKPEKKLKDTSGRKADRSWAKSKEFDWHANMDEGKAYGPTGVSYYVPSGHKDEVNPKTGEKYPERQKSGYKNPSEQKVDEVSSKTLSNYIRKSAADVSKSRGDARRQDKRIGGQKMADDKLRKMQGKGSAAKVAATEADDATVRMYKDNPDMMKSKGPGGLKSLSKKAQKDVKKSMNEATDLTELKKSTLASYIKKASDDRAKNAYDIGKSGKINYKGLKRRQGINRAVNKMAAESTLDRIKKILDR